MITVTGAVRTPGRFDLVSLRSMPSTTVQVGPDLYTGVDLWALLSNTTGVATDPAMMNGSITMSVLATGSDGYRAVLSLAEIDPNFGNRKVLVAYDVNGAGLGRNGDIRLIVGGDAKMGRSVANLVAIEIVPIRPGR